MIDDCYDVADRIIQMLAFGERELTLPEYIKMLEVIREELDERQERLK